MNTYIVVTGWYDFGVEFSTWAEAAEYGDTLRANGTDFRIFGDSCENKYPEEWSKERQD